MADQTTDVETEGAASLHPKFAALLEQFRKIKAGRPHPDAVGASPDRVRALLALQAVTHCLGEIKEFKDEKLLDPLWQLLLAVADIENGTIHPMLQSPISGKSGPPRLSSDEQTLQGMSAVALDILERFGGMTKASAAARVATELKDAGYKPPTRRGGLPLPKAIVGWRKRLISGDNPPAFALEQWHAYQKEFKGVVGADPEPWLARLAHFVSTRRLSL